MLEDSLGAVVPAFNWLSVPFLGRAWPCGQVRGRWGWRADRVSQHSPASSLLSGTKSGWGVGGGRWLRVGRAKLPDGAGPGEAGGIHTLPPEINRLIPGVWQGGLW